MRSHQQMRSELSQRYRIRANDTLALRRKAGQGGQSSGAACRNVHYPTNIAISRQLNARDYGTAYGCTTHVLQRAWCKQAPNALKPKTFTYIIHLIAVVYVLRGAMNRRA